MPVFFGSSLIDTRGKNSLRTSLKSDKKYFVFFTPLDERRFETNDDDIDRARLSSLVVNTLKASFHSRALNDKKLRFLPGKKRNKARAKNHSSDCKSSKGRWLRLNWVNSLSLRRVQWVFSILFLSFFLSFPFCVIKHKQSELSRNSGKAEKKFSSIDFQRKMFKEWKFVAFRDFPLRKSLPEK